MTLEKGVLGNAIRSARLKNNLSQEQLAELVEITPTHLKHIESEHRKPSIEVLFHLCQILHLSLDKLIFDSNSKKIDDIIPLLSDCNECELNIVIDLLYSLKRNSFKKH